MDEPLKAYLLTLDTTHRPIETVMRGVIDDMPFVENWFKFLPGAAILVSPLDLRALSRSFREKLPDQLFMLARLEPGSKDGWLPKPVWEFVNNPAPARKRVA